MEARPHLNGRIFVGILLVVLSWQIGRNVGDDAVSIFLTGLFALIGTSMLLEAVEVLRRLRGPRKPSRVPPLWLVAWVALIVTVSITGMPHVMYWEKDGICNYWGWHGSLLARGRACPAVIYLPLTWERGR